MKLHLLPGCCFCTCLLLAISGYAEDSKEDKKLTRRAELTFSSTSGNSETDVIGAKLDYQDDRFQYRPFFKANYLFSEDDGEESANRLDSRAGVRRNISSRAHALLRADLVIDRFAGYDLRSSAQIGIGYKLLKHEKHALTAELGVLYNYDKLAVDEEESVGPDETEDYTSGRFGLIYKWDISKSMDFEHEMEYSMEFGNGDRDFFSSETGLNVEMIGNLSLGLRFLVNRQETPPSVNIEQTDTTFMSALIWDI